MDRRALPLGTSPVATAPSRAGSDRRRTLARATPQQLGAARLDAFRTRRAVRRAFAGAANRVVACARAELWQHTRVLACRVRNFGTLHRCDVVGVQRRRIRVVARTRLP